MSAALAFQVNLDRFGVWRVAVLTLGALGSAAVAAWLSGQHQPVASARIGIAMAAEALLVWACVSSVRLPVISLRWDGAVWHLGQGVGSSGAPLQPGTEMGAQTSAQTGTETGTEMGDLDIAIDLGPWMLLRFTPRAPASATRLRRPIWLPVQRRGMAFKWHALRCAVYASRHPTRMGAVAGPS